MVSGLGVSESHAAALVYGGAALDAVLGAALLANIRPALVGGRADHRDAGVYGSRHDGRSPGLERTHSGR